jgi:hypothetical protein
MALMPNISRADTTALALTGAEAFAQPGHR